MLPLSLFTEGQFAATNAVTFTVYAALTGATFLLPVVLFDPDASKADRGLTL
jgi:hypothetical protein